MVQLGAYFITQYSVYSAPCISLSKQSLSYRSFLAVTVYSDIRKTCEETAKRIDCNRSESGSGSGSFGGGSTLPPYSLPRVATKCLCWVNRDGTRRYLPLRVRSRAIPYAGAHAGVPYKLVILEMRSESYGRTSDSRTTKHRKMHGCRTPVGMKKNVLGVGTKVFAKDSETPTSAQVVSSTFH